MEYYLSLGSNQGEKIAFLRAAKYLIVRDLGIVEKESSYFKTEPVEMEKGTCDFINQVIRVISDLEPRDFLNKTKEIEKKIGRKNKGNNSDRVIDIDILAIDSLVINEKDFIIPHKEMHLRNFVLVPFQEIAMEYIHPILKKTISELFLESKDNNKVEKI
jgi:2-amino-4-hydroxy-6-hydroxymethyldihydropteridine diphosphokinase